MTNVRRAGHQYERDIRLELIEIFKDDSIQTSRYASKELDDQKVDIYGTEKYGLYVQCKRYKNNPNLFEILSSMPQVNGIMNTVFWKKPRVGEIVSMTKEDFYSILNKLYGNQKTNTRRNKTDKNK